MEKPVQSDKMAELEMNYKALERRVRELENIIQDLTKNSNRDITETPAPQRSAARF